LVRDEATHAYRFTLESAWLLSLAQDSARRKGAASVSSLFLLDAMLVLPGPARVVLVERLNLSASGFGRHLMGSGPAHQANKRLPLNEEVQCILGYAIGEAWNRGHMAVSPLHLALGIARADQNSALDVLAELGVSQADFLKAFETAMPPTVGG
jgi:ATP-dependent Clp protease ATP-binding subunit ClpA